MIVISSRLSVCLGATMGLLLLPACALTQTMPPAPEVTLQAEEWPAILPQITQVAAFEDDGPPEQPTQPTVPTVPDWFNGTSAPANSAPAVRLPEAPSWLQPTERGWRSRLDDDIDLCLEDYSRFYSWQNLGLVAAGVAVAAPIANTKADQSFRNWYQHRIYDSRLNSTADAYNYAAQLWVVIPVGLEAWALAGKAGDNYAFDGCIYEWANRSLRAAAVGYPTVLALFVTLGAKRADQNNSYWHPFNDVHGVSGHAFIGAVPFLTAAAMTDNPCYQVPLVLGSMVEGWDRIHMDRHYLSQVIQGWWLAYLSVKAVDMTQSIHRSNWTICPTVSPEGAGMMLQIKF
jgi:hypothetical protein